MASREIPRPTLQITKKKFFGFGREALPNSTPRPTSHSKAELNVHTDHRIEDELKLIEVPTSTTSLPQNSTVENLLYFSDEELEAESQIRGVMVGREAWQNIPGLYQQSSETTITERTYQKVICKQTKYRLKDEYNISGKEVIITAP